MRNVLSATELHYLAMNTVGRALQELSWEFLLVNSNLHKDPQFVCVSPDGKRHFIIVRAVLLGADPDVFDPSLMEKVKQHAATHKAHAYWAGVGLTHLKDPLLPLEKGEAYQVRFNGLLKID